MKNQPFGSIRLIALSCAFIAGFDPAGAAPKVLASIKPVHSLVAAVMQGVSEPEILVDNVASAHDYNLKPSDADKLQNAELIFWIGHSLETFLEKPLENLSSGAVRVELSKIDGLHQIKLDENHAVGGHAGSGFDPHIWLDPQNVKIMMGEIERQLSALDPDNSSYYKQNLVTAEIEIDALEGEIEELLMPVKHRPFIVFHDAYRHFEYRFGLQSTGSITSSPEVAPGAGHIVSLRKKLADMKIRCVFGEVGSASNLAAIVVEGSNARTASLNPLGIELENGPGLYFTMMRTIAHTFRKCLS